MKSQELDPVPEQPYSAEGNLFQPQNYVQPLVGSNNRIMRPQSAKQPAPQGLISASYRLNDQQKIRARNANRPTTSGPRKVWARNQGSAPFVEMQSSQLLRRSTISKGDTEEQMAQESLKFKQDVNGFKIENIQLKTKIQQFERDIEKKNKLIQSIIEQINSEAPTSKKRFDYDTPMIFALKKQVKDLRDELKAKNQTVIDLEKNLKSARVEEIELKLNENIGECKNIRSMVEETLADTKSNDALQNIKEIEEKLHQQSIMLTNMRKENEQLMSSLNRKDIEFQEAQQKAAKVEEKAKKYGKEHKDYMRTKMALKNSKKELDGLQKQVSMLKVDKNEQGIEVYQTRIEELIQQQREIEEKINEKETKISQIKDLLNGIVKNENYIDENEIMEMRSKITECESELSKINANKKPSFDTKNIEISDISSELTELKFALMNLQIVSDNIKSAIFKGFSEDDKVTIYELTRIFIRFLSKPKERCEKLAKFLVIQTSQNSENNNPNEFTDSQVINICIKLKEIIGNYSVFNEMKEKEIKSIIIEVFLIT